MCVYDGNKEYIFLVFKECKYKQVRLVVLNFWMHSKGHGFSPYVTQELFRNLIKIEANTC